MTLGDKDSNSGILERIELANKDYPIYDPETSFIGFDYANQLVDVLNYRYDIYEIPEAYRSRAIFMRLGPKTAAILLTLCKEANKTVEDVQVKDFGTFLLRRTLPF